MGKKNKKKILIVFGTRPEAIKMAPVIQIFQHNSNNFDTKVCVTGQHREMLDQVLNVFGIVPDYDLNIMKQDQDLFDITTCVITGIKNIILKFFPDLVLVQGDTTTSMAASLAAFYFKIPVGHVEAGLRTNDIYSPWPEEMNRQITSRIASLHFAPTKKAKRNLMHEGIDASKIVVTGNTVIDALMFASKLLKDQSDDEMIFSESGMNIPTGEKIILITGHRRENFGDGLISICNSIVRLSEKFPDVHFIYPVHLNPNIKEPVTRIIGSVKRKNIHLIDPLDYLPFIALMGRAYIILTDSGGIQEEAPGLGIPVLVTRKITERPEGLRTGIVKLVGNNEEIIFNEIARLLSDKDYYNTVSNKTNPYGDGKAAEKIEEFVRKYFSAGKI
jgi:UDP-N-acetylglucosamine 2-epimerase (non-hydrolysing)